MLLNNQPYADLESHKDPDINNLVVKIMTEKFNKKYGKVLDEKQSMLIREYVFSKGGLENNLSATLKSIKEATLNRLNEYSRGCDNQILQEKLDPVILELKSTNISKVDDILISKYLLMCQLQKEFSGEE